MIGTSPKFDAENAKAALMYWQESASSERKTAMVENFKKMPDEQLAKLTPSQRDIKEYVRNGPIYWYDAKFDSSPLWQGVETNLDMVEYVWGYRSSEGVLF